MIPPHTRRALSFSPSLSDINNHFHRPCKHNCAHHDKRENNTVEARVSDQDRAITEVVVCPVPGLEHTLFWCHNRCHQSKVGCSSRG
jgi:hypothetical protein